jgi:hypothetical protein
LKNIKELSKKEILLAGQCAEVLAQGVSLIRDIDDRLYTSSEGFGKACVGSHFRHILDFATNLLNGLDKGKINYNQRERDLRVEQDRKLATNRLSAVIEKLQNLSDDFAGKNILVSLETQIGDSAEKDEFCYSSILRELDFLQSHTIHHYALIASKLLANGYEVDAEFGVAPSTLDYWNKQNKAEKAAAK